ncbi:hypothetical protein [Escherichia phage phiA2-1]|nr:hypothetical protein [Escherichia phage phiA2-1]
MAIYDAGTASLAANGTVTGVGTTWMAPLTLIRVGATIVFKTEPVKIYTISEIISDTQINVYNPNSETVAAGTGYAILLHDGITVQGLAQDVAETLRFYQSNNYVSGGDDGNVKLENGGTGASTAPEARNNLGLGTSAVIDHGYEPGQVQLVFGSRIMRTDKPKTTWTYGYEPISPTNLYYLDYVVFMDMPGPTAREWAQLAVSYAERRCYIANSTYNNGLGFMELYHSQNVTVDSNGFLKKASPIIKVFSDGGFETNEQSKGATVERVSTGVYRVSGVLGLNSDASWGGVNGGFEIPLDANKQPRIWLDYEVESNGSIVVKTYHRTHDSSPSFARNKVEGFSNGDPIDIPSDSFVSIRVNMP